MFVKIHFPVSRRDEPLDKLPPARQLWPPSNHSHRRTKVLFRRKEIGAEPFKRRRPVCVNDLTTVLEVVFVLQETWVFTKSLKLVPISGKKSVKGMSDNQEPRQKAEAEKNIYFVTTSRSRVELPTPVYLNTNKQEPPPWLQDLDADSHIPS